MLSQYVETTFALRLVADGAGGMGYLLKDRVDDLEDFADAVRRIARGGSVIDPEVVAQLVGRRRARVPLDDLTDREREVLALMAEGRSNQAICDRLYLAPKTVEAHISSIFSKLELLPGTGRSPARARGPRAPARLIRSASREAQGLPCIDRRGSPDGDLRRDRHGRHRRTNRSKPRDRTELPMSRTPLARIAGPIALATGGLLLVQQLLMVTILDRTQIEATMASPLFVPLAVLYFVGFCGLLATLVSAYAAEADEAGRFGALGFLAAVIGTMFLAGDLWFEAFAVPWLGDVAPTALHQAGGMLLYGAFTSYILFAVGWVLFGLASFRARVFPRLISVAIIVGGAIGFQGALPPFAIPLALALGWLGIWMIRSSTVSEAAPAQVAVTV